MSDDRRRDRKRRKRERKTQERQMYQPHTRAFQDAIGKLAAGCGARSIEAEAGLTPPQARALVVVADAILASPDLMRVLAHEGAYVQQAAEIDGRVFTWDVWRRTGAVLRIQLVGPGGRIDDIAD